MISVRDEIITEDMDGFEYGRRSYRLGRTLRVHDLVGAIKLKYNRDKDNFKTISPFSMKGMQPKDGERLAIALGTCNLLSA